MGFLLLRLIFLENIIPDILTGIRLLTNPEILPPFSIFLRSF
jgi:hypothetical protein